MIPSLPGDERCDDPEDHHGDGAGPDGDLPAVPVRHQAGAEGAEGEPCEEQQLGESLEPAVLADQVPLGYHGGHPVRVELVVQTASNTVAQHLLLLGQVA